MTIAPNPKTNPKPNPNTNRGGAISLGDNSLVAPYNPKTNPDLDPNPTPNPGAISLGGNCPDAVTSSTFLKNQH